MNRFISQTPLAMPGDFPTPALTPTLSRTTFAVAQAQQANSSIVCPIGVHYAALAVQGLFDAELPNGGTVPLNNFTYISSPSGSGRSTARRPFQAPFLAYQFDYTAGDTEATAAYGTIADERDGGLIVSGKPRVADTSVLPNPILQDATIEGTIEALAQWPSASLTDDEGRILRDSQFARTLPTWIKLLDGDPVIRDLKTTGKLVVKAPRFSMLVTTQTATTRQIDARHGERIRNSGLSGRMLTVHLEDAGIPRYMSDVIASPLDLSDWNDRIKGFLDETHVKIKRGFSKFEHLKFTGPAMRHLISLHNEYQCRGLPGNDLANFPEHCARQMENIVRMAGGFHAFEQMPGSVSDETVDRAATIVKWHTEHYKRRFLLPPEIPREFAEATCLELALRDFVYRTGLLEIKRNNLRASAPNVGLSKAAIERALLMLCSSNYTRIVLRDKTAWVELNPEYFQMNYLLR